VRIDLDHHCPAVAPDSWVAPGATLIGAVTLEAHSSVWYGCVLRADGDEIRVGAGSNVQDLTVIHADPGKPVRIGAGVSVGHRAILHGCTISDDVLIGMGAIVLNHAQVGAGSILGAGALVTEGMVVPPHSLVLGAPGRVRRTTTDQERADITRNARTYHELTERHRGAVVNEVPNSTVPNSTVESS
jgi:carbonic anhydrase/acetyltransferase-like protein (isoleucine patch superfamily)